MADDNEKIDSALKELAWMGQRITELAGTFEAHREAVGQAAGGPGGQEATEQSAAGLAEPPENPAPPADGAAALPWPAAAGERSKAGERTGDIEGVVVGPCAVTTAPAVGNESPKTRSTAGSRNRRRSSGSARRSRRRRRRRSGPWAWSWRELPKAPVFVSTMVHVVVLVGLALWFMPGLKRPEPVAIISGPVAEEWQDDLAAVEVESLEQAVPEQAVQEQAVQAPEPAEAFELTALPEFVPADPFSALSPSSSPDPLVGPADPSGPADSLTPNLGDLLASLGGPGDGGAAGGGQPTGDKGDAMANAATFFGRRGAGKTALFMCDNSASYADGGFQAVLLELSRAVGLMKPNQSFHIVFFSDSAYPLFHPDGIDTFLAATPENKKKLDAWLGTVELCVGGQGIRGAASLAAGLEPDVIYFLSDGDHAESVIDRMAALPLGDTVVHTFGMQADIRDRSTNLPDPRKLADQQERNAKLLRIAAAHGGTFTPVSIPPQAALAASVRPVRKNRVRGPIWGTNLPAAP